MGGEDSMRRNVLLIGLGMVMCLTSCANTIYPVTAGSYRSLPKQSARLLVWGTTHAEAETTVIAWLQKRGFVVIDRYQVHKILNDRTLDRVGAPQDEPTLLQAALSLGADSVVFVEISGAMTPVHELRPASAEGDSASVVIRGVDVRTREVEWNAQALYPHLGADKDEAVAHLACQALATVWGFRPAGYHEIASTDMCQIEFPGQTPPSNGRQRLGRAARLASSAG
jgi:hypothetical protein